MNIEANTALKLPQTINGRIKGLLHKEYISQREFETYDTKRKKRAIMLQKALTARV